MDLLSPLRLGVRVTRDAVKLAAAVPRAILHAVAGGDGGEEPGRVGGSHATRASTAEPAAPAAAAASEPSSGLAAAPEPAAAAAPSEPSSGPAAPDETPSSVTPLPTPPQRRAGAGRATTARRRTGARRAGGTAPRRAADESTLAETEGAAAPGAEVRVEPPWEGYDAMRAAEIVARLRRADASEKAVVRLYEQAHKKRRSVLDAAR